MTHAISPRRRRARLLSVTLPVLLACGDDDVIVSSRLAVAWEDESRLGTVDMMSTRKPWPFQGFAAPTGGASQLGYGGGRLYVLSLLDGTIREIDPADGSVRDVASLGAASQPEDIVVVGASTVYVTRRTATHLLRLNLNSGAATNVVDLSRFADSDGIPDLGKMVIHEGRLFVQIRREKAGEPRRYEPPGYLAVIDLATEQLVDVDPIAPGIQAIELQGTAPKHRMQVVPETRRLFVSASGEFFDEGGIEVIDLDKLRSLGLIIREADGKVGADVGPFVMVTPQRGYLVFSTELIGSSHLRTFSVTGEIGDADLYQAVDYHMPALEFDAELGALFVPDGIFEVRGIHVFDVATNERLTTVAVGVAGKPTDILLIPGRSGFRSSAELTGIDRVSWSRTAPPAREFGSPKGVTR